MNLRELFIEWLTASRYIKALESHHAEVRRDLESVIARQDKLIVGLRIELADAKAEGDRMRLVLMPLGSPAGQMYAQKFQAGAVKAGKALDPVVEFPLDWQGELNKMLQEEEDGLRNGRRVQEHEPRTDAGAQAQHGTRHGKEDGHR